ncbi:MAG: Protein of unknown function (DUF1553)/Protein of unknown function (DUF1549)/Planctomycete, partial [Verrucomicrobiales bacterium]|nr:Protein of unknown function (DUF1553)/Protein of unknown function (DUF1549)/Planctomycete [Verrucomicrobiales bacterium]
KVALTDKEKSLFELMHEKDGPYDFPKDHFNALYDVPTAQKIRALNRKLAELDAQHPGSPPKAMVLVENGTPTNPHVFVRGNPGNQGPEITRHFLQVIAGKDPKPFQHGSGRLEMAEAIASKDNPLTARVYVNRVWLLHFGSGIVSTPSDFGVRSDPPSHPELLDYLASNFMENGWSTKKLHKLMMLSSTYQQSSESNPAYEAVDQSNRYLWKMNRQRLDLEALRDTLLAVSGKLDKTMGGHPVEITTETYSPRRTVYGFIDRQNLPGFFRTFDFASPDTSSSKRFYTTVPQQALFLLNSPFVVDQAKKLASQLDTNAVEKEVTALYEKVLQRKPRKEELAASKSFLTAPLADDVSENSPWSFGYGELNLQEGKLLHFQPLAVFKDKSWQGGDKMPDDKLGWVQISAAGGHPGNDLQHAGVRRWVAPVSGTYEISGKIAHPSDQGDGVRATIISSKGVVKTWDVKHDTKETTVESIIVQKGDVLDFVVDPKESVAFDSYMWSPSLTLKGAKEGTAKTVWNSESDFSGPVKKKVPLTRIEELAQVLLLTNELSFVD